MTGVREHARVSAPLMECAARGVGELENTDRGGADESLHMQVTGMGGMREHGDPGKC